MNEIKIRTPYTHLSPITHMVLKDYPNWQAIDVSGSPWAYTRFMQQLWDEHEDVIIIEHDVIPFLGAPDQLWECDKEWCGYATVRDCLIPPSMLALCCTKIKASLMDKVPDVWATQRKQGIWEQRPDQDMFPWSWCDGWLADAIHKQHVIPHQHFPSIVNANPNNWTFCKKCGHRHAEYLPCGHIDLDRPDGLWIACKNVCGDPEENLRRMNQLGCRAY